MVSFWWQMKLSVLEEAWLVCSNQMQLNGWNMFDKISIQSWHDTLHNMGHLTATRPYSHHSTTTTTTIFREYCSANRCFPMQI